MNSLVLIAAVFFFLSTNNVHPCAGTYQGYSDNSTWTRGHTWSIYGYAMIYRYLGEPRFLERSLGLLG